MGSSAGDDGLANGACHENKTTANTAGLNATVAPTQDGDKTAFTGEATASSPVPSTPASHALEPDVTIAARVVQFFATATPATLAGVAVGFAAVTYMIFGQLGLLLIGAVAGAGGYVAFEARHPEAAKIVRGEKGVDILERLWLDTARIRSQDEKHGDEDEEHVLKSFDDFRPETREALGGLVDAVIRDYVKWWYTPIVPNDHSFPLACRRTLTSFVLAISNHLYRKRPADAFLDLLTNSSSMVIVFMSELANAFSALPPDSNMSPVDTVYNYLASNPESNLANLLNQQQQAAKFKMVSEDMLEFLERNSYNCGPAKTFLREIFANSVLEVTLQTCSKAEWINGWIIYLLEEGEPDLSQAIDVGMQTGRDASHNAFSDVDGNVGNVGLVRAGRSSTDLDRGRRKESLAHKKKLSKAEEELDGAMEEMKRINAMIARDDARRNRESLEQSTQSTEPTASDLGRNNKEMTPGGDVSPTSGPDFDKSSPPSTSNDGLSTKSEPAATPVTPISNMETSSPNSSPQRSDSRFTSFDQVVRPGNEGEDDAPKKAPLTLHNASFTLHDEDSGDRARIRTKPSWDYLIQVEPSSSSYPGWMIVRRYSDFETLHEILRRIAAISGATAFTELHKELPFWKIHTRESLRGELERYLRDACWYQSLAESEGMRRFLEKSQGHTHTPSKTFGWESVGKNMLDALTTAPKGAVEGGKTLVGGVSGVFGNFPGLVKKPTNQSVDLTANTSRLSLSTPPRMESMRSPARSERTSLDSQRSSVISTQPGKIAPMERRPSYQSPTDNEGDISKYGRLERMDSSISVTTGSARASREHSRAPSLAPSLAPLRSPSSASLDNIKLPPNPDEIADDFEWQGNHVDTQSKNHENMSGQQSLRNRAESPATAHGAQKVPKPARQYSQVSEQETRVAVELLFAVINEMYTLSSAWNIRRTLLAAAKSYLLRPGNPSLLTVQTLIQSSVLEANTSDAGIAAQLRKLRENTMPTDAERATWPAELTAQEKERLRVKARSLLIRRGVPAALMGVMGQAATGDALGRVFDCLQVEKVARGLMFGLMLQAVRVVTH